MGYTELSYKILNIFEKLTNLLKSGENLGLVLPNIEDLINFLECSTSVMPRKSSLFQSSERFFSARGSSEMAKKSSEMARRSFEFTSQFLIECFFLLTTKLSKF